MKDLYSVDRIDIRIKKKNYTSLRRSSTLKLSTYTYTDLKNIPKYLNILYTLICNFAVIDIILYIHQGIRCL